MHHLLPLLETVHREAPERLAPLYERHRIPPERGPGELAHEIRLSGSNTLASVMRLWEGASYDRVVRATAGKLGVETEEDEPVPQVERRILAQVLERAWERMTVREREDLEAELGAIDEELSVEQLLTGLKATGTVATTLLRQVITRAVAGVITRLLLRFAGRQAASRAATLAGVLVPGVNLALGIWTLADLTGPAWRKTVPTVVEIALLRLEFDPPGGDGP